MPIYKCPCPVCSRGGGLNAVGLLEDPNHKVDGPHVEVRVKTNGITIAKRKARLMVCSNCGFMALFDDKVTGQ